MRSRGVELLGGAPATRPPVLTTHLVCVVHCYDTPDVRRTLLSTLYPQPQGTIHALARREVGGVSDSPPSGRASASSERGVTPSGQAAASGRHPGLGDSGGTASPFARFISDSVSI
jgi:hypothetical protein